MHACNQSVHACTPVLFIPFVCDLPMSDPSIDPATLTIEAKTRPRAARPPRHIHGRFLRGPIAWEWLMTAARLPGRALHVAIVIWDLVWRTDSMSVHLSLTAAAKELVCDRSSASRALAALAVAGLVETKHVSGRKVQVTVLNAPTNAPEAVETAVMTGPTDAA